MAWSFAVLSLVVFIIAERAAHFLLRYERMRFRPGMTEPGDDWGHPPSTGSQRR